MSSTDFPCLFPPTHPNTHINSDLFPQRLYNLYIQLDPKELLAFLEEAEGANWWMDKAMVWMMAGSVPGDAGSIWPELTQRYPSLVRVRAELADYIQQSVEKVQDADAKFFALKARFGIIFSDWSEITGIYFRF